jgi:hypothetical protein
MYPVDAKVDCIKSVAMLLHAVGINCLFSLRQLREKIPYHFDSIRRVESAYGKLREMVMRYNLFTKDIVPKVKLRTRGLDKAREAKDDVVLDIAFLYFAE